MKYELVMGLETHVELSTESKISVHVADILLQMSQTIAFVLLVQVCQVCCLL